MEQQMNIHRIGISLITATVAVIMLLAAIPTAHAQQGRAQRAMPPIPKMSDGKPSFGWTDPQYRGVWRPDRLHRDFSKSLLDRPEAGIPLQPWAKALYEYRIATEQKDDPEGFCLPAGGIGATSNRTAAPWEFLQLPEQKRIFRVMENANSTWQEIHMDGRGHPEDLDQFPKWLGHSIGRWEGDTLVVETTGFNEGHWLNMMGLPRTSMHKVTERFTRVDYETLRYEATFDDPGAYTRPWRVGWDIKWDMGAQLSELVCPENNKWPELMKGARMPTER
jgi:hypothetical protein